MAKAPRRLISRGPGTVAKRVLHILSQRPGRTGSGVTVDALVREAAAAGWEQAALVGVPADETRPDVGGLPQEAVHRVTFAAAGAPEAGAADLPFPVPGMSDVMPYPSSVWSRLGEAELAAYRQAWRSRLAAVIGAFRPDVIHTNHVWLVSALLKDVAPEVPAVATCHATGLRQLALCPHLADEVIAGCRRLDRFCVLREDHRDELTGRLGIDPARITVVGAGFRTDVFGGPPAAAAERRGRLLYAGKTSAAKGVPTLLEAFAPLAAGDPGLRLDIAGGGTGPEAEALHARMDALGPQVARHGAVDQAALADLMRRAAVFVLPSLYEGVPLVLAEAAACGCRVVATALPGVTSVVAPCLGDRLALVEPPRLVGPDRPEPADLPGFAARLRQALATALDADPLPVPNPETLAPLTWSEVYKHIERQWLALILT
jgi:glycosyltransferase involved in cell wall biosynthesis